MDLQTRLLEELVYERVRLHVDLCELLEFERDLEDSIDRAVRACGVTDSQAGDLARRYVEQAWHRIEEEWQRERALPADCPLCEGPFQCPQGSA